MNSMDKSKPELPLAIPLMDVDHKILPLHFAIDPGEETFTQKTTPVEKLFDTLAKSFVLTEQDKIELLKKYFDIITLAHVKENCVEVKKRSNESTNGNGTSATLAANDRLKVPQSRLALEKAQTLPTNFGRKPNELTTANNSDSSSSASNSAGKSLVRKSSYLLQRPFVSFGRMSKRIKKNIGHLARRSASFRLNKGKDEEKNKDKSAVNTNETTKEKTETKTTAPITLPELTIDPIDVVVELVTSTDEEKESIINTDNSVFYCETYVFAARLQKDKRPFYYDDMIKNYLNTARARFLNEKRLAKAKLEMMPSVSNTSISSASSSVSSASELSSSSSSATSVSLSPTKPETDVTDASNKRITTKSDVVSCVSPNCSSPSSATTNYLCNKCFEEQRQQMASFGNKTETKTISIVKATTINTSSVSKKVHDEFDVAAKKRNDEINSFKSSNVQSTYKKEKSVNNHEDYDHHLEIDKIKHLNKFSDRLSPEFYVPNSL